MILNITAYISIILKDMQITKKEGIHLDGRFTGRFHERR